MSNAISSSKESTKAPVSLVESSRLCGYIVPDGSNVSAYIPRSTLGVGQIYSMVFDNLSEGEGWGAEIWAPSVNQSIQEIHTPELLEAHLDRLYSAARGEMFEVGMKSQFSRGLQQLCAYAPVAVMQSLKVRLVDDGIRAEVLAETLEWASEQEAIALRDSVIDFLSMGLRHASSLVRDSAALSLASLDEAAAIPPLQRAFEREKVPELRDDLGDLIRSLKDGI